MVHSEPRLLAPPGPSVVAAGTSTSAGKPPDIDLDVLRQLPANIDAKILAAGIKKYRKTLQQMQQQQRQTTAGTSHEQTSESNNAERLNLFLERGGDVDAVPDVEDDAPKTVKDRLKQNLRIAVPHIGLVLFSCSYALMGMLIFHSLENAYDHEYRNRTFHDVIEFKHNMTEHIWSLQASASSSGGNFTYEELFDVVSSHTDNLIHFTHPLYTKNYMLPKDLTNYEFMTNNSKWNFAASLFFSWTAITTIGYGHIVPRTTAGRIVCLVYALIGIPLVLVTIADMGRFLSAAIIWMDTRIGRMWDATKRGLSQCFGCCKRCCLRITGKSKLTGGNASTGGGGKSGRSFPGTRMRHATGDRSPEGTFEDISEIQSSQSDGDGLGEGELDFVHEEKRVSVLFVLTIMICWSDFGNHRS